MLHRHVAATVFSAATAQVLAVVLSVLHGSARAVEAFAVAGAVLAVAASAADVGGIRLASRQGLAAALVTAWASHLSVCLYRRNRPPRTGRWALAASRACWSAGAALPVVLLIAVPWSPASIRLGEAAAALAALAALVLQAVADAQKHAWHQGPRSDEPCLMGGVWALSRHPNLFGETAFHVCVWVLCARGAPAQAASFGVLCVMVWHVTRSHDGPLVMLERTKSVLNASSEAYAAYVRDTSVFVPMPRGAWAALGPWARAALLEADWSRGAIQLVMASARALP